MNISIFGLGYVGAITAACLANEGHSIIGVDIQQTKVDLINSGQSPIVEEKINEIIEKAVQQKRLIATTDPEEAVHKSEMAIVCVGTPSRKDGSLQLAYVAQVIEQIGNAIRAKRDPFHLVVRSTIIPGTMRDLIIPILEKSSRKSLGDDLKVVFHPEFLREGSSVYDFYHPPKIVVGEAHPNTAQKILDLYSNIEAPRIVCDLHVAEMVKYCDNLFHALKITFANEVGQFCHSHGIDSQEVMEIFCQDRKLNISHRYLKPGFAFGGSCLPKDLRAFLSVAKNKHIELPVLGNILASNYKQIERAIEITLSKAAKKVGFYGIAFKPGTDDLRESPFIEMAERLLGKGKELVIYDKNVQYAFLMGGNKSHIQEKFPHLAKYLTEQEDKLEECDLILIAHPVSTELIKKWKSKSIVLLNLGTFLKGDKNKALDNIV